ncbi:MAG TPA: hypothetical protein VKR22_04560 [Acidimicrobiales bacterium]|nr:hypothetical protein [Acidimicrobiales bacterium]
MASGRTWNLVQGQITSGYYDVQARSLLAGHWYMPASLLGPEAIKTGGHFYMYFGPVPSLLRLPVLILTHQFDGRLSGVSMLVAELVALGFTSALLWRVRGLVRKPGSAVGRMEALFTGGLVFVVGAGSSLLYVASWLSIYDEAEIWACALALGTIYFMIAFIIRHTRRSLLLTALFVSLTLFTRAPVGIGLIGALMLLAALELVRRRHAVQWLWPGAIAAVSVLPLAAYAYLNEIKFHSLFSVPFERQAAVHITPTYGLAVRKNGGSLFGAGFLPTNVLNYLRPNGIRFTSLFPWISFRSVSILGKRYYGSVTGATSIVATAPALVGLALFGLFAIFRRTRRASEDTGSADGTSHGLAVLRIPVLGAALSAVSIFVYGYLSSRYLTDLLPLVILTGVVGFSLIVRGLGWPRWLRRSIVVGIVALGLFGVWAQTSLGLVYQGAVSPGTSLAARKALIGLQESIDGAVFGDRAAGVGRVRALKAPGPAGGLAIVGNCSGLYQSTGKQWIAVETSKATDQFRFELVGRPGAVGQMWPMLVGGDTSAPPVMLAIERLSENKAVISYRDEGANPVYLRGKEFVIRAGRTELLNVYLGSHGSVFVTKGLATVFDQSVPARPAAMESARNSLGGPAGSSASGPVRLLPPAPICSSLLHAFRAN